MTAALEKQILASQKFLGTVRHLPSFPEARDKQVENLLKKISKTPVQVEHAAALVELLDSSIWGSHVDALKSAVIVEEASQKKNVALQDYLALPHYLTTGLWKALGEDTRRLALEKICKHCKLLGLSNPSEVTQAMILVLVFDVEGHMLGSQQWQVTLREKGNVQKCLKQSVLHSAEHHLLALPQNREECPAELWTRAFGAETPVESMALRGSFETCEGLADEIYAPVCSRSSASQHACAFHRSVTCSRSRDDASNGKFYGWIATWAEANRGSAAAWLQADG